MANTNLTREEEYELGWQVQAMMKAKELLDNEEQAAKLTTEERKALQKDIRIGNRAVDTFVRRNLGLVYREVRKFRAKFPISPDAEDLVQEGMIGLLTAIKKYDPSRGNKFSTAATHWIFQAVSRKGNEQARLVRIPENRVFDYSAMISEREQYEDMGITNQNEITERIIEDFNISREDYWNIVNAAGSHASLNAPVSNGEGHEELGNIITVPAPSCEEEFERSELTEVLNSAVAKLGEMERDIVRLKFGFGPGDAATKTIRDLRAKHGVTLTAYNAAYERAVHELRANVQETGYQFADFDEAVL